MNSDPNHPLVKKLQSAMTESLGKDVPLKRMLAATDARWFTSCGVPVVMVGANGSGAHSLNEKVSLSTFEEMKKYLTKFIVETSK
jgi:acetylornithine deacetylase/succinyl-diaminopimelate desuccinylase-like protein